MNWFRNPFGKYRILNSYLKSKKKRLLSRINIKISSQHSEKHEQTQNKLTKLMENFLFDYSRTKPAFICTWHFIEMLTKDLCNRSKLKSPAALSELQREAKHVDLEQISSRSMGREAPVRWQQMSCQNHWHDPWQQLLSLVLTSRYLKHWSCCSRSDKQCHSPGSHIQQENKEQDSAPSLINALTFTSGFSIGFGGVSL